MTKEAVGEVYLRNVRLSFADNLFIAGAFEEGAQKKYQASFVIDPETPEGKKAIKDAMAAAEAAIAKRYEGKKAPELASMTNDCFGDADEMGKEYDGYAGMWFVAAKNHKRVPVYKGKLTLTVDDYGDTQNGVYSGCYVDAIVQFYVPKDEKYKRRLCCSLQGVKFRAHGEPFSGGTAGADRFDDTEYDVDNDL